MPAERHPAHAGDYFGVPPVRGYPRPNLREFAAGLKVVRLLPERRLHRRRCRDTHLVAGLRYTARIERTHPEAIRVFGVDTLVDVGRVAGIDQGTADPSAVLVEALDDEA